MRSGSLSQQVNSRMNKFRKDLEGEAWKKSSVLRMISSSISPTNKIKGLRAL